MMDDPRPTPEHDDDEPETQINQDIEGAEERHPDANDGGTDPPPVRSTVRSPNAAGVSSSNAPRVPASDEGGNTPAIEIIDRMDAKEREHAILGALVCLRLLTYDQLYDILFRDTSRSHMRKWTMRLIADGRATSWQGPPMHGQRGPVYFVPTQETADRIAEEIRAMAADLPYEGLVRLMVPKRRSVLTLGKGEEPKWLQHQTEVNALATRIFASARDPFWISAWPTPFPKEQGTITFPQPDYVLVERDTDGELTIVFGEHDRGTGPVERFVDRKIQLYDELALLPGVAEELFGVARFRVDTTVIDRDGRRPMARLEAFLAGARVTAHPELFRFTLGGWLHAHPDSAVWFTTDAPPSSDAVGMDAHIIQ